MFQVFKSSWLQKRKVKFCLSRPIKNSRHSFSRIFKQDQSPWKRLGFHLNFSTYKRKTLAMFWRYWRRLVCYSLWDLRGFISSNYTRIYQSQNYNQELVELVTASRSTSDGDLKPLSGILKSQARQLAWLKIQEEKESVDSKLARGHVNKLLLEVALDLGLNLL